MKKGTLKIIIFVAIIIAAVVAGILIIGQGNKTKSNAQLDLGNKALLEMDYEDAILFYEEAIKLNPKNVDAYLKIAEAYVALGDYITACEYLNIGYDNTGDASIWNMLDSLQVDKYISLGDKYLSEGDGSGNKKFDPYGFTFLEQPVHTDCYEGLKAASGYSGNDDIQVGFDIAPGNGYGENIMCRTDGSYKSFKIADEVTTTETATHSYNLAVEWSVNSTSSQYKYVFAIHPGIKYRDVKASNFDGPIKIGTTLEDAIKIIGCDIDPSQTGDSTCVMEDGSSVSLATFEGEGTNSIEKGLYISNDKYYFGFRIINDVVEGIYLNYN